jgi:microcin C transport system substrate-binding protein
MTKSRVQAKAVDTSKLRNIVVRSAIGLAVIFGAMSLRADEAITKTHGFNFFGELKYPADYKHLDYVNPNAPKGGEISIWTMGTFDSFNPYTRKGRAGALASAPFESLLEGTSDEVGTSYGLLAETLEYPEDQSWVIFNMRPEARFSDGTPVTAEDVAFTYELFLNEGLASYRAILGQIVTGVEILGPHRIKYSFADDASRRDAIPIVGGLPVKSKAWFEKTGAKLDESRMEPAIGSGPYVLDSYDINKRITYKRNPDYWGKGLPFNKGRGNFDTIRIEYFADSNAAFEGFKSGAYTFRQENSSKSWATAYDFPALDEGHVIKTLLPDGGMATGQSYVMNLRRDKFNDIRVRQAVGLLFNFEWSNESLFYGQYARINSFWENSELAAEGMPSDAELALLEPIADLLPAGVIDGEAVVAPVSGNRTLDRKNLRKASALLDEAGWTVGDDGLRRNAAGETLTIEIIEDSPTFDRVHLPFIDNLKAAGIDAIYSRIDPAQMTDRSRNYDFDMMVDQFPMSLEPSSGLKQYFGSETADQSVFNSMGLKSEAVDALIEHVMKAQNKAELATSVKALDRTLRAYYFWVPQWFNDAYRVAYWNMYERPETLPPFALGNLDFWWYNAEKAADLKAKGVLR